MRPRQTRSERQRAYDSAHDAAPRLRPTAADRLDDRFIRRIREDNVVALRQASDHFGGAVSGLDWISGGIAELRLRRAEYRTNSPGSPTDWKSITGTLEELTRAMKRGRRRSNETAMSAVERARDELADLINQPRARSFRNRFGTSSHMDAPRPGKRELRPFGATVTAPNRLHDGSARQPRDVHQAVGWVVGERIAQRFDSAIVAVDRRQLEALKAGLAAVGDILKAIASQGVLPNNNVASGHTPTAPPEPIEIEPPEQHHSPVQELHAGEAVPARSTPWLKTSLVAALMMVTLAGVGIQTGFVRIPMPELAIAMPAMFRSPAKVTPSADAPVAPSSPEAPQHAPARLEGNSPPLPGWYGIYAVSGGQLVELEALPGQVPDPRVAISAPISQPSRVVVPDGRLSFIVFRRDMASTVTERIPIRVVAKVRRAATPVRSGDARDADPDDIWRIRNVSFEFNVGPVDRNPDMVLIRSKVADFVFPPGRYALVLKGQAYDFTVAGPITDRAQCLERIEAANGGFYHECEQAEPETGNVLPQELGPASRTTSKPGRSPQRPKAQ